MIVDRDEVGGAVTRTQATVFLSYARKDMEFVDQLELALKARGIEPLIDRSAIYAFEKWWPRIQDLITKADTIVFVLSPDAVRKDSICHKEIEFAQSLNKRFAPIVCQSVSGETVPEALRQLNWIFFIDEPKFDANVDKLSAALRTDIGWIRKHTEFGEAARRWGAAGRVRGLLLGSVLLDEAERWIAGRPKDAPEPTDETRAFIAESRRATRQRRKLLTGSLAAGLLIALGLAGFAYVQRDLAVEERRIADLARREAEQQRDQALQNEFRFLTDRAVENTALGNAGIAMLLALEAARDTTSTAPRPYVSEAEVALFDARQRIRESHVLAGHTEAVESVTFSPDATRVVTSGDDTARVWDVETGTQLLVLRGGSVAIFSPDGAHLITGSSKGGTVRIWDAATGSLIRELGATGVGVDDIAISPDGRRIVTTSDAIRVWDAETGALITTFRNIISLMRRVAFNYDGSRLVTAPLLDRTASIIDAETGREISVLAGHQDLVRDAAFSPDGQLVATASHDNTVQLWDSASGKPLRVFAGHERGIEAVRFSPDGKRLISASWDGTARVWDVASGKMESIFRGHDDAVRAAMFTSDGSRVLTGSRDGTARIWTLHSIATDNVLRGHGERVTNAAFSQNGRQIVTASYDRTARVWDVATRTPLLTIRGHTDTLNSALFSADGRLIVTAAADKTARVWDAITGEQRVVFARHESWLSGLAVSPDADRQRVATTSHDKTIRVWDIGTGEETLLLQSRAWVLGAAFSADGKHLATASDDRIGQLWEMATGRPVATITVDDPAVTAGAFNPDNRHVVVRSGRIAQIWDTQSGKFVRTFSGHAGAVTSAVFSPDGHRVLTASGDTTARIWDVESGKTVAVMTGHTALLDRATYSSDGRAVATASVDNTARIWRVFATTQELVDEAKRIVPRCLTRAQREKAFLKPEPPVWCIEMAKWPYARPEWKEWLTFRRAGANPPMPDEQEWKDWVAARR